MQVINNLHYFLKHFLKFEFERNKQLTLNQVIMGLFGNNEKKNLNELCKKSEAISNDLSNEIQELLTELKTDYEENRKVVYEFSDFVNQIKSKLDPEEASKLLEFTSKLSKVKRCAKKGVEAMYELSRDQRKATRETIREYQEYLYV